MTTDTKNWILVAILVVIYLTASTMDYNILMAGG